LVSVVKMEAGSFRWPFVCRIHYGCLPPTALLLDDDDPDELPYQALVLPHSLEPH
jgi:hypothetical protein